MKNKFFIVILLSIFCGRLTVNAQKANSLGIGFLFTGFNLKNNESYPKSSGISSEMCIFYQRWLSKNAGLKLEYANQERFSNLLNKPMQVAEEFHQFALIFNLRYKEPGENQLSFEPGLGIYVAPLMSYTVRTLNSDTLPANLKSQYESGGYTKFGMLMDLPLIYNYTKRAYVSYSLRLSADVAETIKDKSIPSVFSYQCISNVATLAYRF